MTGTPLALGLIVIAAVLGVTVWLTLVLLAARRPYFRHPHPESMPGKVRGGMHVGDGRSLGPPEGERADLPEGATEESAGPGSGERAHRRASLAHPCRSPGIPLPRRGPRGTWPLPGQR